LLIRYTLPLQKEFININAARDIVELSPEMSNLLPGTKSYLKLYQYGNSILSLSKGEVDIASLDKYKHRKGKTFFSIEHPSIELVSGFEKLVPLSESEVIIPNDYGFALLKVPSKNTPLLRPAVHIRSSLSNLSKR